MNIFIILLTTLGMRNTYQVPRTWFILDPASVNRYLNIRHLKNTGTLACPEHGCRRSGTHAEPEVLDHYIPGSQPPLVPAATKLRHNI